MSKLPVYTVHLNYNTFNVLIVLNYINPTHLNPHLLMLYKIITKLRSKHTSTFKLLTLTPPSNLLILVTITIKHPPNHLTIPSQNINKNLFTTKKKIRRSKKKSVFPLLLHKLARLRNPVCKSFYAVYLRVKNMNE